MPMHAATALLQGGPRNGFAAVVQLPAPQLVTVTYCERCRREHVHSITGYDVPLPGRLPRYLLDQDATIDAGGRLIYRWLDVDDTVDQLLAPARRPVGSR